MTAKTTISFTYRHHEFARRKVEEGEYASLSSLVAAGIEQVIQDEREREAALDAMKETIRQRLATRSEDWIDHHDDPVFDRLRAKYALT